MKRRIDAPEKSAKRIEVGNDWVEIKLTMSYEQFMECQDPEKAFDKQKMLIKRLVSAWSFTDENGQPLPVTPENIDDNMDAEIFFDVIAELNQLPFLQRLLARANQGS